MAQAKEMDGKDKSNHKVAIACVFFVVGMIGMSYAAVPLYEIFCRVTGFGGTTQIADVAPQDVLDREVTVRFDANVNNKLPVDFKAETKKIKLKIGAVEEVNYLMTNLTNVPVGATASFNVSPPSAGAYFNKLECFCFTEQVLKGNETQTMPVIFFIDPEYVNDPDTKDVGTITLSYTFFPDEIDEEELASLKDDKQNKVE